MNDRYGIWWCKRSDGSIVEHETDAYNGHAGHVRCVLAVPEPSEGEK